MNPISIHGKTIDDEFLNSVVFSKGRGIEENLKLYCVLAYLWNNANRGDSGFFVFRTRCVMLFTQPRKIYLDKLIEGIRNSFDPEIIRLINGSIEDTID